MPKETILDVLKDIRELLKNQTAGQLKTNTPNDERVKQARALWDLKSGEVLGYKTFEEYLANIPEWPQGIPFHLLNPPTKG